MKVLKEAEIVIDTSRLKSGELTVELAEFLEEKTGVKAEIADAEIRLRKVDFRKPYLRVLVRKFLHREDLRDDFRLIIEGEKLIVKERKFSSS